MKYQELEKNLIQSRAPAYNIFGADAYLREKALKMITGLVKDFPDMNVNMMGDKADPLNVRETCELLPMMGELRVVAAELNQKKDAADIINAYLKKPNPSTILVITSGGEPCKGLKNIELVDCDKLSSSAIQKIIANLSMEAEVNTDTAAAQKLIEYCSSDMTRISSEINKLISWAGQGGRITEADVTAMVEPEAEYRIYQLADAAARGNGALCMRITDKCMADKIAPSAMLAGLYTHFRRLLYCAISKSSVAELSEALGVKPFAVENAMRQAKLFTPMRLKRINDMCNQNEMNFKSGKIYEYNALMLTLMYIVNLSGAGRQ